MVHHMTRDMSRRSLAGLPAVALVLTVACAHAQITGEAETRKFVSCRTLVTWTGPQGTQVSYLGAGNKAYLWAPGNDTVLSGTWRVDPNATSRQSRLAYVAVCAQYGGSTRALRSEHRSGNGYSARCHAIHRGTASPIID